MQLIGKTKGLKLSADAGCFGTFGLFFFSNKEVVK